MNKTSWRLSMDDGPALHVEEHTAPDAQAGSLPVLFVNGITMSTESWNQLGRLLQDGRTILRYDMRGQGASDAPPGRYLRERHARDLLALLEDLKERGRAPLHVVALSNGGYVTQLLLAWLHDPALAEAAGLSERELGLLAGHRATLASLSLLDTFATADARLQAAVRAWLGALAAGGAAARFDAATPWVWGPEFLAANTKALADARELAADHPQDAVRALLEGLLVSATQEPDLSRSLAGLDLPLLVAVGEDDVLTPVRNHREVLAQFGREQDGVHLIPQAGHAAPIENPEAVAALVAPFLRQHDTRAVTSRSGVTTM